MKAALVLLLLGAAAVSALPSGSDNIWNRNERGVDCGDTDTVECTCISDLTREPKPPRLININNNSQGGAETGIFGDDLVVAVKLDVSVFVAAEAETDGFNKSGPTEYQFSGENTDFLVAGRTYSDPTIWFVDYRGDSDDPATGCNLTISVGNKPNYTYGTDGNECDDTDVILTATYDLTDALRNCGWKEIEDVIGTGGNDAAQRYTVYEGKFKVQTDKYNGNLRGSEVILREEFPFWIQIQFPEIVNVSSNNVSVIGAVVEQAALTHQIWDSALQEVDLNAFIGVSYPYALANSENGVGAPGGSLQVTLEPNWTDASADECNGHLLLSPTNPNDTRCAGGQSAALYRDGVVCDRAPAGCGLEDFFDFGDALGHVNGTVFGDASRDYNVPTDTDDFATTFSFSGGSSLPASSCPGQNVGSANTKACKQNLHLRLKPRAGWCDLNFQFLLTVGVVCRDDSNGDDQNEPADSWIADGRTLTNGSDEANRLTTNTGALLPCSSTAAPDKTVQLLFSLASDDFCARVIETAEIFPTLAVFESEATKATWGARCGASGDCADFNLSSTSCAGSLDFDQRPLCRQVPLLFNETGTPVLDSDRKTQTQFVFGTTTYLETRVYAEAGVNIATTTITNLWISAAAVGSFPNVVSQGVQGTFAEATWAKKLGPGPQLLTNYKNGDEVNSTDIHVVISDDITVDSLITDAPDYFAHASDSNPADSGTATSRLGKLFEGVSRASVLLDEYSVHIQDPAEEAAESVKFWAGITITYKDAEDQETLSTRHTTTSSSVPSGFAARAGLLAAPALTGRTVSAQGSVSPSAGSGTAGSSSTIAGFSSTVVVAAAVVVGAVALAAVVGLVVVRNRRAAARSTKRTSSTQELNDTAQVQV